LSRARVPSKIARKFYDFYNENNEIQIILFERGKELENVGVFKYRFIGSRKKGKLLKWPCTKNDCTATIYSGQEKNVVLQSNGQHYHDGNSLNKIQRQVFREKFKRRAELSMSIQPLKLIRHVLLHSTELTSIVHKDLKTVRKAIYDRRTEKLVLFVKKVNRVPALTYTQTFSIADNIARN